MDQTVCLVELGTPSLLDGVLLVLEQVTKGNIHPAAQLVMREGSTSTTLELRRGDRIVTSSGEWVLAAFRDLTTPSVVFRRYIAPTDDQPAWDE
jgi:hypothetical protein